MKSSTAYYLANIGKVTTVNDFVNNYRLFSYAMKAYGLSDMTYAKGLITKLLNGGTTSPTSLAQYAERPALSRLRQGLRLHRPRRGRHHHGGGHHDHDGQPMSSRPWRITRARKNQGVQLALYFKRQAPAVTSAYGILADSALLKVVQTAYGIPASSGVQDIDVQAAYLNKVLNIKDLQDPTKLNQLITRFTAEWDAGGNNSSSTAASNALLVSDGFQRRPQFGPAAQHRQPEAGRLRCSRSSTSACRDRCPSNGGSSPSPTTSPT